MNRRQEQIVELLQQQRELPVRELAERFSVTQATIRRDLDLLERDGRLVRTHGSALLSRAAVVEFAFAEKSRHEGPAKHAIGAALVPWFTPGMTVVLDTGTTTLEVAKALAQAEIPGMTVLTTSLAIAAQLYTREHLQLVLLGGLVRKNDPDLSGVLTEQNLRQFRVDLAVMGADSAAPDGVYTSDLGIARVSQAMIAAAQRRVLALDSTKFARRALYRYAEWPSLECVVTDEGLPPDARQWLTGVTRVEYVPLP
jgi:DeoR family fructose operon transcriptional repressor